MIYRRIRHWHIADTRNSGVIHSRIVMVTTDVFFRMSSALMCCLFSLWCRRFMFCILLHVSRILACLLLHISVVQPAWPSSHAGEWMFTHGFSSWAILLGFTSYSENMTCKFASILKIPFKILLVIISPTIVFLRNELYGLWFFKDHLSFSMPCMMHFIYGHVCIAW